MKKACIGCGEKFVPNKHTPNHQVYCSRECNIKNNKWVRNWYRNLQDKYCIMKENIGCQICGFNESGVSLDWHHPNGRDKQIRLHPSMWQNNPEKFNKEIEGCVLLCKNHHFMIHEMEWRQNE